MVAGEPVMTPFLRKILGMNWVLVLVMYGLLIFGVFMIESAARHVAMTKENLSAFGSAGAYFASKQKSFIFIGSVAYFVAALIDYRWIRWLGIPFYVISMVLMVVAMHQNDGLSYGQIARKLGLTRGQVAGRAYRHEDRMILERSRAR